MCGPMSKPTKKQSTIKSDERRKRHIVVRFIEEFRSVKFDLSGLGKLVKAVCFRFGLSEATVNIALIDDARMRRLNKQFFNRNTATDCLSFDLSDNRVKSGEDFELAVNAETAVREASRRGHSAEAELALYVIHCLLESLVRIIAKERKDLGFATRKFFHLAFIHRCITESQ